MKLKFIAFILSLSVIFLSGCIYSEPSPSKPDETSDNSGEEYIKRISSLEEKIEKLSSEYYNSDKEKTKELEALRAELEQLLEAQTENKDTEPDIAEPIISKFTYKTMDKGGVLTGYVGSDTSIVLPSYIDGIKISEIGESAFSGSKLTTVIISEGIEYIDWFAFFNSPFLTEITIPSSVTRIGYSAFDGCSSSLTIYCERDSYAHSYAKSYGISYMFI